MLSGKKRGSRVTRKGHAACKRIQPFTRTRGIAMVANGRGTGDGGGRDYRLKK